jgi:hypothetical protein
MARRHGAAWRDPHCPTGSLPARCGTPARHEVCLVTGMSLPYPREVETGQLSPRRPEPRAAFDVEASIQRAIVANGAHVDVFGVPYAMDDATSAEALVERYRSAVLLHFNERVAAPDAAIWQLFAAQVHDQLEHHAQLDDDVLEVLRLTIDNL